MLTVLKNDIPENSVDFIYIGLRHDYCGMIEDMNEWWKKLKPFGIMAGHDYITAFERLKSIGGKYNKLYDHSLCYDGKTVHEGAEKGAVDDFARAHKVRVYSTHQEKPFPTWILSPKRNIEEHINNNDAGINTQLLKVYTDDTSHKYKLPNLTSRQELGNACEERGFTSGAELGVQRGLFSKEMLDRWPNCTKYLLVDLWAHQPNYKDAANVATHKQLSMMNYAKSQTAAYENKTIFIRNYTTLAALDVAEASLDFIYVDARHDYCGVMEDMTAWWPKLKRGGIMAGHDYMTALDQLKTQRRGFNPHDDWSICYDGKTVHEGAVKVAVNEFAARVGVHVFSTAPATDGPFLTWIFSPKT